MNSQTFAAAIAAEFREVGIFRSRDNSFSSPVRGDDGRVIGPVCFWVNNTANPPLGFLDYQSLVSFLDDNDDETVLSTLDRIAAGI